MTSCESYEEKTFPSGDVALCERGMLKCVNALLCEASDTVRFEKLEYVMN